MKFGGRSRAASLLALISGLMIFQGAVWPDDAWAYIPPSSFIVKNIAARHVSLKNGVRIKAEVASPDTGGGELRFRSVIAYDVASRTLRGWATDGADRKLYQVEKKADTFTIVDSLAFEPRAGELEKALLGRGIAVKTEIELQNLLNETERRKAEVLSLKRHNGNPCWVIGKLGPSESELWIEKDSFQPLRVLFGAAAHPVLAEVQIEGYRYQHGFGFAKAVIVFGRNGAPLLREENKEITVGSVAVDLKVADFKPGYTDEGNAASSELRALIEQYFSLLR